MAAGKMNRGAVNNGATWGTLPAFTAAGCGFVFESWAPAGMRRNHTHIGATGIAVPGTPNKGGIEAEEMTITLPFNFEQHPRFLHSFATDVVATVGAISTHTMTARTAAAAPFLGMAFEVPNPAGAGGSAIYMQATSAIGSNLVVSSNIGEVVKWAISQLCRDLTPVAAVTMTVPTVPNSSLFAVHQAGDTDFFAIADRGSALVNRGISGHTATLPIPRAGGDHSTTAEYIGLPDESGYQEPMLEIRIPNFIPVADLTDFTGQTAKNALFTYPPITVGAVTYTAKLKFPHLVLRSFTSPQDGPNKMNHVLTYEILADPNGTAVAACDTTGGAAWEYVIENATTTNYNTAL